MNNKGSTFENEMNLGNLTFAGSSLPADELDFDNQVFYNHVPFQFMKTERYDNLVMEGQKILFPTSWVQEVHILGGSNDGDFFDTVLFMKDDEVQEKAIVSLSNFVSSRALFNDKPAFTMSCIHSVKGKSKNFIPTMWHTVIQFEKLLEINKIQFEDNSCMHVFALTFKTGSVYDE